MKSLNLIRSFKPHCSRRVMPNFCAKCQKENLFMLLWKISISKEFSLVLAPTNSKICLANSFDFNKLVWWLIIKEILRSYQLRPVLSLNREVSCFVTSLKQIVRTDVKAIRNLKLLYSLSQNQIRCMQNSLGLAQQKYMYSKIIL